MKYVTIPPMTEPIDNTVNTAISLSPCKSNAVDVTTMGKGTMAANTAFRKRPSNPYFTKNGFSSMGFKKSISTN